MNTEISLQKRILIVEDEASIRQALCDKFTREGFIVFEAKDGQEGLATAIQVHPDVIILDLLMPKMDGMAMLRKLRAFDVWSYTVPIVLLTNTGNDNGEHTQEIANDVYTSYAVKSNLSITDVVAEVKHKLCI